MIIVSRGGSISGMMARIALGALLLLGSPFAAATPPTLFSQPTYESPVRGDPGDLLLIPGDGFSATNTVVYQSLTDTTQPLVAPTSIPTTNTTTSGIATIVSTLNVPHSLTVSLPSAMTAGQSYALWVVDSSGAWSNGIKINDARPIWYTPDFAYTTAQLASLPRYLKIVGRNLAPAPGATTQVRLTGPSTYTLNAANDNNPATTIENYAAIVTLPTNMAQGYYSLQLSRDGVSWVTVNGTNIHQFQIKADPTAPNRYDVSSYGCSGSDDSDDTACIVAAMNAARANGSGTVYFPAGTWHMGTHVSGVTYFGVLVAPGVNLVGAGSGLTTIVRDSAWGPVNPIFTVQGNNTVSDITFQDAITYTSSGYTGRGLIQLGIDPVNAQAYHSGDPTILTNVVITNNVFDQPFTAIDNSVGAPGMPIDHLFITYNTFGAYANNVYVNTDIQLSDSVIAYNTFYPGSYITANQGPISTQLSSGYRVDLSNNVSNGTSSATQYLYPGDTQTGFRAAHFWSLEGNEEGVLISDNTALCSGDKAGDGEAIAFDDSGNLNALPTYQPALASTATSVTLTGPLTAQGGWTTYPDGYYWVTIAQGPGLGQTRRIVSYSGTSPVTLTVDPAWDVQPQATSQLTVSKQYWQVYVVDNFVDQRTSSGCTKANGTKPSGGKIDWEGQSTDSAIEGNQQYDTSGIWIQVNYTVTDSSVSTVPDTFFHNFTEIRNNTVNGEYYYNSYCSWSGIEIQYQAGPHYSPPPVEGYGISINHNSVSGSDGFGDGAVTFSRPWYGGPSPDTNGWDAVESALVFNNSISNIVLPEPGAISSPSWTVCPQGQSSRIGSHIEDGMAWHTVYAHNSCSNNVTNFVDGGTRSQRVCTGDSSDSCECPLNLQSNGASSSSAVTTQSASFPGAQVSGDLNVVVVSWSGGAALAPSVDDTSGNAYYPIPVITVPTGGSASVSQAIFYTSGIAGASSNTVTATWPSTVSGTSVQVFEYSGIDTSSSTLPLDNGSAANSGNGTSADSGWLTTTNGNDLVFSATLSGATNIVPGTGYTTRLTSSGSTGNSLVEDQTVTAPGALHATATVSPTNWWATQVVPFRLAGGGSNNTQALSTPTGLTAAAASGDVVNLNWTQSTDNLGAGISYLVERCPGSSCSNYVQIGSVSSGVSYTDSGLTTGTSYNYRVRATDPAGILTPYTSVATVIATP